MNSIGAKRPTASVRISARARLEPISDPGHSEGDDFMQRLLLLLLITFLCNASASANGADAVKRDDAVSATGLHDFDFEFGKWRVHHRVKPRSGDQWLEFDGTCSTRGLTDGSANVEEHTFDKPGGISYGIGLRAYDAKTRQWAIWWVDGRDPHGTLDPPVKGRFENGVGTFYSDYMDQGKAMRVRYLWSHITPTSARWEQASSSDAGKTWETSWIMQFER
ncbi:MAG: hypothetical protein ACREPX_06835, partial [Rhodanobacteraceae bacterium]